MSEICCQLSFVSLLSESSEVQVEPDRMEDIHSILKEPFTVQMKIDPEIAQTQTDAGLDLPYW